MRKVNENSKRIKLAHHLRFNMPSANDLNIYDDDGETACDRANTLQIDVKIIFFFF